MIFNNIIEFRHILGDAKKSWNLLDRFFAYYFRRELIKRYKLYINKVVSYKFLAEFCDFALTISQFSDDEDIFHHYDSDRLNCKKVMSLDNETALRTICFVDEGIIIKLQRSDEEMEIEIKDGDRKIIKTVRKNIHNVQNRSEKCDDKKLIEINKKIMDEIIDFVIEYIKS